MTDTADKPSLKDIAEKDAAKEPSAEAKPDAEAAQTSSKEIDKSLAKSGGGFLWFVVIVAVIGGSIAAGWPYIGPRVEPAIKDIRALMGLTPRPTQARLPSESPSDSAPVSESAVPADTVSTDGPGEASVSETPASPQAAPESQMEAVAEPADAPMPETAPDVATAPADTGDLAQRLGALESQIGALSGADSQAALNATIELTRAVKDLQTEVAALSNRLQAQTDRIQALEDGTRADPTAPAQALVLGVTQLRARLTGDSPFAGELAALEQIANGDATVLAALQRLKPHAEVGVPSEAALTARFAKVAKAIVSARSTSEAEGWLGAVKDGLGGLVTVRRTDPAAITDAVERAVAVAEAALELGELGEAVKALSDLQGAPGDAAAAWLGDAHARVEAEAALEDLHSHALAVLSAAGGA